MNNIEWKFLSVCYAGGVQWLAPLNEVMLEGCMAFDDFQLNEIRTGDFIEASELGTEQKYNDVVEVFGLFGFENDSIGGYGGLSSAEFDVLMTGLEGYTNTNINNSCKRKLTYSQIIAIGKLKMLIDAPKNSGPFKKPEKTEQLDFSNVKFTVETPIPEVKEPKKSAKDYLNECIEVQKQRGEQYDQSGTGERSFAACATAYNAITGGNLKGSDICLVLQILKDVRQYSNPSRLHEDSLLDKVSYSSLHVEELNKELK